MSLLDERACDFCRTFKTRYLAVEGQAADDEPDLVATAEELVSLVRWNIRMLKAKTKGKGDYDPDIGRQVQALVKSANGLLDSVRKIQEQGQDALRNMGLTEKVALVQEFLDELPAMLREKILAKYRSSARPLGLNS